MVWSHPATSQCEGGSLVHFGTARQLVVVIPKASSEFANEGGRAHLVHIGRAKHVHIFPYLPPFSRLKVDKYSIVCWKLDCTA